jgi:hypothetical protein
MIFGRHFKQKILFLSSKFIFGDSLTFPFLCKVKVPGNIETARDPEKKAWKNGKSGAN